MIDEGIGWVIDRYKPLLLVPIGLLILSAIVLLYNYSLTGEFLDRDFDLKGGTRMIAILPDSGIETRLEKFDVKFWISRTPVGNQITIEIEPEVDKNLIIEELNNFGIYDIQVSEVGAFLGEYFWDQVKMILPIVFILIALVVFISFRSVVPALTILFCIFSNAFFVLGMMALLHVELSLASVAALLMIIGYSVDDDILLYTHVLKRKEGSIKERIIRATKTGVTMTTTALVAALALYFVSGVGIIREIANVLIFGLIADFPYTWIQSAGILKLYLGRK